MNTTNMTSVTTEDLLATIQNFPKDPEAVNCAKEYLRRCGQSGYFAEMAKAILARSERA